MKRKHLQVVRDAPTHAVVETDEHEAIEIDGCSADEVDAKLRDLYAWAS